jgi:hypothetical protein
MYDPGEAFLFRTGSAVNLTRLLHVKAGDPIEWNSIVHAEVFAKFILLREKGQSFGTSAPCPSFPCRFAGTIRPLPPMGAREFVAPQYYPAPAGGRMSEGQKGGF